MKSTNIRAYVLSTKQYGESDLIVSLFSLEKGKIRVIAKGAKKSQKRFVNVFEPCSLIQAQIMAPRYSGLYLITEAQLIKNYTSIALDPLKFIHANLAIELVDLWCREEDNNSRVFYLLNWFLMQLEKMNLSIELARISLFFQIKILVLSGYCPDIKKCIECSKVSMDGVAIKAISLGDCSFCDIRGEPKVSIGSLMTFLKIVEWDTPQLLRIQMSRKIMLECWLLIIELNITHLERVPHSYNMLKKFDSLLAKALI